MEENTDKTIKISVVIPVYNAEAYISRCIESLKAQTLKELEFIFVDDCSPDKSMIPAEEWAAADPRVRILRNEHNLGEGGSRNRGIEAARGIYINTIDPDDRAAENYYELLYAKAVETSADIVKGTRIKISEKNGKEIKPRSKLNSEIKAGFAKGKPLYLPLNYEHQTLIYKRSLLDAETRYGKSGNSADTIFLLRLCSKPASFAIEDKAYYYYLQRKGSATAEFSLKRSRNELVSLEEQIDYLLRDGFIDKYAHRYCARRFNTYASRFAHAYEREQISLQEKEKYLSDFRTQILRLSGYDNYYKIDPVIYALLELDITCPTAVYKDFSISGKQTADWISYIQTLDRIEIPYVNKRLGSILAACVKAKVNAGASLREIGKVILQMASELRTPMQKALLILILSYAGLNSAFFNRISARRKATDGLLSKTGKQRL